MAEVSSPMLRLGSLEGRNVYWAGERFTDPGIKIWIEEKKDHEVLIPVPREDARRIDERIKELLA